jgi:tetratricopeptide (TPR) repeat protein
MTPRFADNPDFRLYEQLLLRVHELIAAGEGDSEEADELRERMDAPWHRLTEAEQTRLRGLSGDLYLISGTEIPDEPFPVRFKPEAWVEQLQEARDWNDWGTVLGLVRRRPASIFLESAALLRAQAYDALGHPNAGLAFLDFAYRANKADPAYRAVRMLMASNAGRLAEAVADAERALQGREKDISVLVAAADVLLMYASTREPAAKIETLRRTLEVVRPALSRTATAGATPMSLIACAHLIRTAALWELGETADALTALDAAIDADPGDRVLKNIRDVVRETQASNLNVLSLTQALEHRRDLLRREFHSKSRIAA